MTTTTIAIGILALAGVAVLAALAMNANKGRRAFEDVPPAMRPAYSDEQLEKTVLERYMAWGAVFFLIFAVFFPVYWYFEEQRINQAQEDFVVADVVLGEDEYQQLCAECHGAEMQGGAAASPYGDGAWPAPALNNIVLRYDENPNIDDIGDFIWETLQRGRPGTPMPAWGEAYGGPLVDQQIDALTQFILLNQVDEVDEGAEGEDAEGEDAEGEETAQATNVSGEDLYAQNCAKCHGLELEGIVGPTLVGVLERHSEATVLGILQNGIYVPTGAIMPPWQNGYMYEGTRFDDEALQRIIDYLAEAGEGEPPANQEAAGDGQANQPVPPTDTGDEGDEDGGDAEEDGGDAEDDAAADDDAETQDA